jgi:hypothetical protein
MIQFPATLIWKAITEPKCKFFAWLVLHDRVFTSHNLIKRNWPCDYNCAFCVCIHETDHLLTKCNYTEAAWNACVPRLGLPQYSIMLTEGGLMNWMEYLSGTGNKRHPRMRIGMLFTFWWNIWKERNNKISREELRSPQVLSSLIVDEIKTRQLVLLSN